MTPQSEHFPESAVTADRSEATTTKLERGNHQVRLWTPLFVGIVATTLCCYLTSQGLNTGTSVYLSLTGNGVAFAGILAAVFSAAAVQKSGRGGAYRARPTPPTSRPGLE